MIGLLQKIERGIVRRLPLHVVKSKLDHPVASFSFDDFPASAAETGAAIMESRGARATFYACGSLEGTKYRDLDHFTAGQLKELAANGHEVGCHAFNHVPYPAEGPARLRANVADNAKYFHDRLGDVRPSSFAYPFGDVNFAIKAATAELFPIARGVRRGVNRGRMDYSELRANPLDKRWEDTTDIPALIDEARRTNGWLIFFTHDVQDDPTPEGCHPDRLARTLDAVLAAGIAVMPVKAAAALAKFG